MTDTTQDENPTAAPHVQVILPRADGRTEYTTVEDLMERLATGNAEASPKRKPKVLRHR